MTEFQKDWITSTLAPESIKSGILKNVHMHELTNPDKTRKVYVAELNNQLCVIIDLKDWTKNAYTFDTFSEAVDTIVGLLNLSQHIKI